MIEVEHRIGLQHGSLFACASWFDLTEPLHRRRILSLDLIEAQVVGVEDESSFVSTYQSQEIQFEPVSQREWNDTHPLEEDKLPVSLTHAIMDSNISYILITLVVSKQHRRVISPNAAVIGFLKSLAPQCNHPLKVLSAAISDINDPHSTSFIVYDFSRILECWGGSSEVESE